jgi:hypothetical protein
MIKIIKEVKNPKVLIVTPLWAGHKISKETKKTLKRNDIPFTWISSSGRYNIPTNLENGLNWYDKKYGLPDYYMMIDRDIIAGRHLIDKLYEKLSKVAGTCMIGSYFYAYAYASFQFKGTVNCNFPAVEYDIQRLLQANYISSNSMFLTEAARAVGLVKNRKYERLLDWAFLLKLLKVGYVGIPCPEASFIAVSNTNDISAGSAEDYKIKHARVSKDFILPMVGQTLCPSAWEILV